MYEKGKIRIIITRKCSQNNLDLPKEKHKHILKYWIFGQNSRDRDFDKQKSMLVWAKTDFRHEQ